MELGEMMGVVGRGAYRAGAFVGRKVAEGYRSIDPDVARHIAQTPLLGYSLLVPRHDDLAPGEADGRPPLIFVHGLGGNRGNFLLMQWYLRLMGRKRGYKIHFGGDLTIEEMALELVGFIRGVLAATGEGQVELVAHSMGGLVARLALAEEGVAPLVRTVITLGSPHRGTYPARFANTVVLKELRPDSELMARLGQLAWPEGVRGVTFWSRNDLFVLPAESAALEGTEQIDVTPFTHYSYLIDPKSWAAVAGALEPPS